MISVIDLNTWMSHPSLLAVVERVLVILVGVVSQHRSIDWGISLLLKTFKNGECELFVELLIGVPTLGGLDTRRTVICTRTDI